MKVLAHAKLNLVLRVVGRRADGYHLIQSLFCAVDLADELILEPIPRGIELLAPSALGPPEQNLAFRAAQALLGSDGPGVRIHLEKRIPVGAGLGGGSSDAAAVLAGLNALFGLGKTPGELMALGAKIGADVPFFLGPSPAWVEGIGERISPAEVAVPGAFLLVIPPFRCSTALVYKAFDELGLPFSPPGPIPNVPPFPNDLWPAAVKIHPELPRLRAILEELPSLGVGMSGSGSTLFLAFPSRSEAEAAKTRLSHLGAELRIARPVECGYKIMG
ncbi:MAG: 4-(cytidine 5'-diphospho)-2-C-methyl-D-erythritol kinase [Candidatus Bipolaricaulaceae bacterium]